MTCTKMILMRVSLASSADKNFFKASVPFLAMGKALAYLQHVALGY